MPMPISFAQETLTSLVALLIEQFPEQYNQDVYNRLEQDKNNPATNIGKIAQAVAMSDFVAEVLQKQPHFLHQWWQQTPVLADCAHYSARLNILLSQTADEEQLYKTLRQFRNREMANLSF